MKARKSLLNENQARRLEITLYLVELSLDEIAGYLHGQIQSGEMYVTIRDLSDSQREKLLEVIGQVKREIASIRDQFGLDKRVNDVKGLIMGHFSSMWESLHNARPRNLGGFGDVAPELFENLDPAILQTIKILGRMPDILSRG